MRNYWIGGKDNLRADHDAGDRVLKVLAVVVRIAEQIAVSLRSRLPVFS
jgi:hypothetical protein